MNCPNCKTEMRQLLDIAPIELEDYQSWPNVYWCEQCGTIFADGIHEQRTFVPKRQRKNEKTI